MPKKSEKAVPGDSALSLASVLMLISNAHASCFARACGMLVPAGHGLTAVLTSRHFSRGAGVGAGAAQERCVSALTLSLLPGMPVKDVM